MPADRAHRTFPAPASIPRRVRDQDIQAPTDVRRLRRHLEACKAYEIDNFHNRPQPHVAVQRYGVLVNPGYVTGPTMGLAERNADPPPDGLFRAFGDTEVAFRDRSGAIRCTDIVYLLESLRDGQVASHRLDLVEVKPLNGDVARAGDRPIDLRSTEYFPRAMNTLAAADQFYGAVGIDRRLLLAVYAVGDPATVVYDDDRGSRAVVRPRRHPLTYGRHHEKVHLCGVFDVTREIR